MKSQLQKSIYRSESFCVFYGHFLPSSREILQQGTKKLEAKRHKLLWATLLYQGPCFSLQMLHYYCWPEYYSHYENVILRSRGNVFSNDDVIFRPFVLRHLSIDLVMVQHFAIRAINPKVYAWVFGHYRSGLRSKIFERKRISRRSTFEWRRISRRSTFEATADSVGAD